MRLYYLLAGNSTSAVLDGQALLTILPRGETYVITMPYAHCKGILVGNLSMELGGPVSIVCEKTGYFTEMEFKLKVTQWLIVSKSRVEFLRSLIPIYL